MQNRVAAKYRNNGHFFSTDARRWLFSPPLPLWRSFARSQTEISGRRDLASRSYAHVCRTLQATSEKRRRRCHRWRVTARAMVPIKLLPSLRARVSPRYSHCHQNFRSTDHCVVIAIFRSEGSSRHLAAERDHGSLASPQNASPSPCLHAEQRWDCRGYCGVNAGIRSLIISCNRSLSSLCFAHLDLCD